MCLQVPQLPSFTQGKALGHQANAMMLRVVGDTAMPDAVRQVLGPWLVGQVTLARGRLLMQLGSYHGCCSLEMLGRLLGLVVVAPTCAATFGSVSHGRSNTNRAQKEACTMIYCLLPVASCTSNDSCCMLHLPS
jgi:hypothetical protein